MPSFLRKVNATLDAYDSYILPYKLRMICRFHTEANC